MQVVLRPVRFGAALIPGEGFRLPSLRGMLLVRNRPLRLMFAAGLISGFGDRLSVVALAALLLARTESMLYAGLVFVVSTLPYVVFGLFAGTLVDRWDRRWCMVGADITRVVLAALIPLAALAGLPLVYALLFAATCAKMVFTPAQQAAVAELVESRDLLAANTTVRMGQYLTDILGYPAAGLLMAGLAASLGAVGGAHIAFVIDAASFACSAALLSRLPIAHAAGHTPEGATSIAAQAIAGVRHVVGHTTLRTNTVLLTLGPLLLGSLHTMHVAFAWRAAGAGAMGFGVLHSAMGLGVLTALPLIKPVVARLGKGRTILLGFVLYGASVLLTGLTNSLAVGAALAAVSGAANILFIIPSVTLVQQETPGDLRGRVFGLRSSLTYAAFAASNAAVGALLDRAPVGAVMVGLGAAVVGMACIAYLIPAAREAN